MRLSLLPRTPALLALCLAACLASAGAAVAATQDSTPVGRLPPGPVTTITTTKGQLVAIAVPRPTAASGLVWRVARPFSAAVVRQVGEADVGASIVLVFRTVGRGSTSIVLAKTRGDASSTALAASTHRIRAT